MKHILSICLVAIFFSSCSKNEPAQPGNDRPVLQFKKNMADVPSVEPLNSQQIKTAVADSFSLHGDFRWSGQPLHFLWSGIKAAGLFAIGYKPADVNNTSEIIHTINIKSGQWKEVHDAIIELAINELHSQGINSTISDVIYEDDPVLPIIIFKTDNKFVLTKLYNLENVRYIEPYGFWPYAPEFSSSGCAGSSTPVNVSDYSNILPACQLPWNFNNVNIPQAWNSATGTGIKIGIIDAGISSVQSLLGSQFNSGYSNTTRTISTSYTYGASAFSTCTHGTSMCGLAAGPRNALNSTTGVAYNCNLYFIRGCDDVLLDASSELSGVRNALVRLGDDAQVKIISMSVGTPFYSSTLLDGVTYAYNKGKMIFSAAGTSFSWTSWWGVIYPAAYSQCIAVTGVKENGNKCTTCHEGSQVKFTIPMERNADSQRNSLSLPYSGVSPTYIGGSSCATATCAGIAALVWSVNSNLTRTQVYDCLRNTAQFPVPVNNKGYGNPNAGAAVALAHTL
jgi:serine protease